MRKMFLAIILYCFLLSGCNSEAWRTDEMQFIADEIVKDCRTTTEKIVAVKQFVYKTIKPVYGKGIEPLDKVDSLTRIKKGVGWCHNSIRVFMDLCLRLNIKTKMLWLMDGKISPHTIGAAWDGERWVMIDATSPLDIYYDGRLITQQEFKDDVNIKYYYLPTKLILETREVEK